MHGTEHEIVDLPHVAKTHLELLRMRVDVHPLGVEVEVDEIGGLPTVVEHVAITLPHGTREHAIAHSATIDVRELLVARIARRVRLPEPTPKRHRPRSALERQRLGDEFFTHDARDPGALRLAGARERRIEQYPTLVAQTKSDVESRECKALDEPCDMPELGALGTQELASGGHVVEKIAHFDQRPARLRRG